MVCRAGKADNPAKFMCRLPRNSGILNLLEPSGPVHVRIRIALSYREINSLKKSKEI